MKTFHNCSDLIKQALADATDYEYSFLDAIRGTDAEEEKKSLKKISEYRKYYKRRFRESLICNIDFLTKGDR